MVLPAGAGGCGHEARPACLWRPSSRPSCHGPRPASQAEDGEAGWLEEYIGYMQDHGSTLADQVILGKDKDEGRRRGAEDGARSTRVCGTYCISFWCVLELLK